MTDLPKPNIDWTRLARAFIQDGYLPMATGKAALDQADARHAEDQAALASLQQQLDMSLELLAHTREAASILMNKRIAADEARDACAKELADVKRRLVDTDTLVACLRGPYLMQNHLPALALEGEEFARAFLRLTNASVERFRARLAAEEAGKKDAPQT